MGLTRGSDRARIARAVVEAMAYRTRDVVDAMRSSAARARAAGRRRRERHGRLLCQFQADSLGVPVRRPEVAEATALGAAYLAGVAEGVWATPAEALTGREADRSFVPGRPDEEADALQDGWRRAVDRSRGWAAPLRGAVRGSKSDDRQA